MRQVGIFGKRKSGKSALMYALTNHKMTREASYSALEIGGVGKVMLVDTVGVDAEDITTEKSAASVEVALMLIPNDSFELELAWISKLRRTGAKIIPVVSQADKFEDGGKALAAAINEVSELGAFCVSAETGAGIEELNKKILSELSKITR